MLKNKQWLTLWASLMLFPMTMQSGQATPVNGKGAAKVVKPSERPADHRVAIQVSEAERNLLMEEMREFLHGLHSIQLALARKDMNGVALAAKPMGNVINKIPESMRARVPETFIQLGLGQYEVFEVIARDAVAKNDVNHTLGQVAEALTYCSGCHDTYRVVVGRTDRPAR